VSARPQKKFRRPGALAKTTQKKKRPQKSTLRGAVADPYELRLKKRHHSIATNIFSGFCVWQVIASFLVALWWKKTQNPAEKKKKMLPSSQRAKMTQFF
jgi:hypothetical protein